MIVVQQATTCVVMQCEGRGWHVVCVRDVAIGFCYEAKLIVVVIKIL